MTIKNIDHKVASSNVVLFIQTVAGGPKMAVVNKRPILVDQPILDGLKRLREEESKRSTVGAAPSIQELARHILRQGISKHAAEKE
ncbi:hypothetical protein [Serratia marcescens]|uniref:hypothetical protein n=2 Tax=Serratia marcescens TaxID=615 RepID=UPI00101F5FC4|nr:hypothetical protein [Serratia marcescens]